MDWDKLRRAPRINHSRAGSRLEIRKEPHPQVEIEADYYYVGPRPAPPLPRAEQDAAEQYQTDMWAAHRQFSPRNESASTGVYQHSQFRGTPLRKDSDATGTTDFYTESIESCETSRTSSRDSALIAPRIKSFQGLPPLLFQTQSDELFNTQTTLSLESTFEKLELAMTNTSMSTKSIHESNASTSTKSIPESIAESVVETVVELSTSAPLKSSGRDTFGGKNTERAPIIDPEQLKKLSMITQSTITLSNRTTRTCDSGETIPFVMRRSAFPQELLPALSQRNIHPLHRIPTATSDHSLDPLDRISTVDFQRSPILSPIQEPVPILTLHSAPSQRPPQPPSLKSLDIDGGRALQIRPASAVQSQSSDETYKPIHQQVSYSYWRASRPESWGPGEGEGLDDSIDSYYLMDESKTAATAHMRQGSRRLNEPRKGSSSSQHAGAIKRVFGFFPKTQNSNKAMPPLPTSTPALLTLAPTQAPPPRERHSPFRTQEDEKHYNLPSVLPDDFPMQRKNFLGLFSSKK